MVRKIKINIDMLNKNKLDPLKYYKEEWYYLLST